MENITPQLTLDTAPAVPTLTLDAEAAEPAKPEVEPEILSEVNLTPEEQKVVNDFAGQIDLTNSTQILQYGAASQKKVADFSGAALENIRTKDLGEIGDMLTNLVGTLKDFDAEEEQSKGIFGFFKKTAN